MLSTTRLSVRPSARRGPVVERLLDRFLGVSRRRRHAGYVAIAAGLGLLKPMLRRLGLLILAVVLVPLVAAYFRLLL